MTWAIDKPGSGASSIRSEHDARRFSRFTSMFPKVLVSQLRSGHSGTSSGFPSLSTFLTRFTSEVSCTRLHCPSLSALLGAK